MRSMSILAIWKSGSYTSSTNEALAYVTPVDLFLFNIPELHVLIRATRGKATSVWTNVHRPQRPCMGFDRINQRSRSQVVD